METMIVDGNQDKVVGMIQKGPETFSWAFDLSVKHRTSGMRSKSQWQYY